MAFRVSPEEDEQIEAAVRLSGLTKQDYSLPPFWTNCGGPRMASGRPAATADWWVA